MLDCKVMKSLLDLLRPGWPFSASKKMSYCCSQDGFIMDGEKVRTAAISWDLVAFFGLIIVVSDNISQTLIERVEWPPAQNLRVNSDVACSGAKLMLKCVFANSGLTARPTRPSYYQQSPLTTKTCQTFIIRIPVLNFYNLSMLDLDIGNVI